MSCDWYGECQDQCYGDYRDCSFHTIFLVAFERPFPYRVSRKNSHENIDFDMSRQRQLRIDGCVFPEQTEGSVLGLLSMGGIQGNSRKGCEELAETGESPLWIGGEDNG